MDNDSSDVEIFFDDLLEALEEERIIPIIGPDVSAVSVDGKQISLYRLVAESLLKEKKFTGDLRPGYELNDAAAQLVDDKRLLYGKVNHALKKELSALEKSYNFSSGTATDNRPNDLQLLRAPAEKLACISPLKIFVSMTCDDLLCDAVSLRQPIDPKAIIKFAPQLPDDEWNDFPIKGMAEDSVVVFYLFGRASNSETFALHDEDMLEFVYQLNIHRDNDYKHMVNILCEKSLLFIGCPLSDWLGRLLLRTSKEGRLTEAGKAVFMVTRPQTCDAQLTSFMKKFCVPLVHLCEMEAPAFVDELTKRWINQHPEDSFNRCLIFISYASEDRAAAEQLYNDCLSHQLGREGEVWFDKQELKAGDKWDDKIRTVIKKRCRIFIPLISSTTAVKERERYFRQEWDWAASRAQEGGNNTFLIIPLFIDDSDMKLLDPLQSDYRIVKEQFKLIEIKKAPGGHLSEELAQEIKGKVMLVTGGVR